MVEDDDQLDLFPEAPLRFAPGTIDRETQAFINRQVRDRRVVVARKTCTRKRQRRGFGASWCWLRGLRLCPRCVRAELARARQMGKRAIRKTRADLTRIPRVWPPDSCCRCPIRAPYGLSPGLAPGLPRNYDHPLTRRGRKL